jgi:LPS sulfotransferase NodH
MPAAPTPDAGGIDSYLICATPRTGSSLLCGLLDSTGIAGHPGSWFRRQDEREFAARWGIANQSDGTFGYADYFPAAIAAGSTPNGVFAARIMWGTVRAEQTGVWFETTEERQEPTGEPGFDFGEVRELVGLIEDHNAAWEEWFAAAGIQPYRVLYEDLDAEPVRVAFGVLRFLGIDLPADREVTVRHKRLADELNGRWIESYRREARERSA